MARKKPKSRAAVGRLGKALTRRSRGRCELCDRREGVQPYELAPWPEEPDLSRTLMTCLRCRTWLHFGTTDPVEAHFLNQAIWSDVPPVKLAAARLLIASDDLTDPWLSDAIEAAQVDPHTGEFAAGTEGT